MEKLIVTPINFLDGVVTILDQTKLPIEIVYLEMKTVEDVYVAIKELKVRGAPAIGIAGAYGLFIIARNSITKTPKELIYEVKEIGEYLISSRPTAVNLEWAIRRIISRIDILIEKVDEIKRESIINFILNEAQMIHKEDEVTCYRIGEYGATLLEGVDSVLTHCNAGSIATSKYGTALSPIYYLHDRGKKIHVYADETRPLLQGARLTAWELMEAGVEVTLITDSMAGFVMANKGIGAVIVGADRIASNGDVANKIGTYGVAILAKEHGIPFYVAAPFSTFDLTLEDGNGIPIEERSGDEVTVIGGRRFAPLGVDVFNPAFDMTPCKYITAIITEKGIIRPPFRKNIRKLFEF
ncbi:MAG: methylthioribose-1-phosphate isomerase [Fusobacteria bacterium]|nr:MAG: methylthioribose-1-phosphate isomerase [Fusobacteriota bacterium]KAF0229747.1 MAG: methylthioribose-1-phosphate [Fusobacteriota bacterium]